MGLFKNLLGNAINEFKDRIEDIKDEIQDRIEDIKDEVQDRIGDISESFEEVKQNTFSKFSPAFDDEADDVADEPRIQLGKLEDGILEIREGIKKIDDESLEGYRHLRKIIFPASLEKIEENAIDEQEDLEDLDFSRVTKLKDIPNSMVYCETRIRRFIIPKGVSKVGEYFLYEAKAGTEVYVPSSVKEMEAINGNGNNDLIVYLFAHGINIEDMEQDIKTLYVLPEDYGDYAQKLKDCDSEAKLREMPEEAMSIYKAIQPAQKHDSKPESKPEPAEEVPLAAAENDGKLSARLETLINSALKDGILTDKEREIIKKRAEAEGEDWNEVEMMLDARLEEIQSDPSLLASQFISIKDKLNAKRHERVQASIGTDEYSQLLNEERVLGTEMERCKLKLAKIGILDSSGLRIDYNALSRLIAPTSQLESNTLVTTININKSVEESQPQKSEPTAAKTLETPNVVRSETISPAETNSIGEPSQNDTNGQNTKEGTGLIVYDDEETKVLNADCEEIADEQYDYSCIVKLVLPSGIKRIGKRAFYQSSALEMVDFSRCSKLEIIGEEAFAGCKNLKVVDLSGCTNLEIIDDYAFYECKNLQSLLISQCNNLKRISKYAFGLDNDNNKLERIDFPVSLKSIEDYAFCGCGELKEVDFSRCMQLESIGEEVFNCSQLKQVVFPASLKKIYDAFYKCDKLEGLNFSSCTQLEYVSSDIFKRLYNFKVIDFSNCEKLNLSPLDIHKDFEKIILPPGQKSFNAMCIWDQFGYNIDKSLCHFQYISKEAFSEMEEITEIEIPDSVEEIGKDAFKRCSQLKTLIMPASLKKMEGLGWGLERLKKLDFSKVTQLKKIPENVVGSGCPKLRELILPNCVVEIEDDAFSEISNLRTLFLPPTLEEMGELGHKKLDIYCFSPAIEELEPLVVAIFDNEDEEDEEEKKGIDPQSYRINLFVLPQYLEKYIAQRNAERIPEDVLIISQMPDEYLYFYDN